MNLAFKQKGGSDKLRPFLFGNECNVVQMLYNRTNVLLYKGGSMERAFDHRSKKDVTNVFSAILSTPCKEIAKSMFFQETTGLDKGSAFLEDRISIAESRIKSIVRLIESIHPNLEFSGEDPIRPWEHDSLSKLVGRSWPSILGMRVIIPSSATKERKAQMVSNMLASMACI